MPADGNVYIGKTGNPRIALTLAESDHEGVSYLPFFGVVYQSTSNNYLIAICSAFVIVHVFWSPGAMVPVQSAEKLG